MKNNFRFSNILEILVMLLTLFALIFAAICFAFSLFRPDIFKFLLGIYETPYINVLTVLTCIVLALWVIIGEGVNSKLWKWLPPFVAFRNFGTYGRLFIVISLIVGTLVALFGDLFGFIKPM